MSAIQWTWSEPHRDYYYVSYDADNRPVYVWASQLPSASSGLSRQDSTQETISRSVRENPSFIGNNPDRGVIEQFGLDGSYYLRTGSAATRFFVVGRVFAMLYTEPAGAQSQINDEAYSFVRYQEVVYSQIRRFIVVEVKRGFVYACAISTYKNRGTNKPGCVPSEHAIAYFTGTDPAYCYFQGEFENGMNKEAIEVEPAQDAGEMKSESRIRFSKTYPVEMNLKVKDIGRVSHYSLSRLLAYWQEYH